MAHLFPVTALILAGAFSPPPSPIHPPASTEDFGERTLAKLDKLQNMIRAHYDIENTFIEQQKHLQETYGNVEFTNVYQGINLTTLDGIQTVRERLKALDAKFKAYAVAQRQSRAAWQTYVSTADVDEPLRTELNIHFSTVEPQIAAKYAAWFDAVRDNSAAIAHLLDTAQQHLGKLAWRDGELIATDKRTSIDLLSAKEMLANTEHRYDVTGRAALDSHDPTQQMMQAALDELGDTIHHRADN